MDVKVLINLEKGEAYLVYFCKKRKLIASSCSLWPGATNVEIGTKLLEIRKNNKITRNINKQKYKPKRITQ